MTFSYPLFLPLWACYSWLRPLCERGSLPYFPVRPRARPHPPAFCSTYAIDGQHWLRIGRAAAGGCQRLMLFVAASKAWALPMPAPGLTFNVVPVLGLAADTVVGLDPGGFASGFSPNLQIEVSQSATLHFEGTTPTDIGVVAGPPNTVAAPPRSLFQTVSYALKLILPVSWVMRAPGLVQVINSVAW